MQTKVTLMRPSVELEELYLPFYKEWKESGEDMIPWVIGRDPSDFAAMVQYLRDNENIVNIPEGWVPSTTYWLVTANATSIVGAVNIRHRLNEKLLHSGGHIGYGIRPSARQQGYASALLGQALLKAKELGIEKALVLCDAINIGSEKTIRKNGGVKDHSYVEEDGNVIHRFWIET